MSRTGSNLVSILYESVAFYATLFSNGIYIARQSSPLTFPLTAIEFSSPPTQTSDLSIPIDEIGLKPPMRNGVEGGKSKHITIDTVRNKKPGHRIRKQGENVIS